MTTAAQIRKLVKPLLERHSDLFLSGQWIYIKPVRHIARAILIDRTGEASRFRPRWAVIFLCEPSTKSFGLNWGGMLYNPSPDTGLWKWDAPSLQDDLFAVVENAALPLLRPVETLDDFAAFASRERFPSTSLEGYDLRKIVVDVARGDFESARSISARLLSGRSRWSTSENFELITKTLCPLLAANDIAGMVRLLREWEAYTVRQLKLEAIWERTPFPVERLLQPARA